MTDCEVRAYLSRELANLAQQMDQTPVDDIRFHRYLQGMSDAFARVVLFLDCKADPTRPHGAQRRMRP